MPASDNVSLIAVGCSVDTCAAFFSLHAPCHTWQSHGSASVIGRARNRRHSADIIAELVRHANVGHQHLDSMASPTASPPVSTGSPVCICLTRGLQCSLQNMRCYSEPVQRFGLNSAEIAPLLAKQPVTPAQLGVPKADGLRRGWQVPDGQSGRCGKQREAARRRCHEWTAH